MSSSDVVNYSIRQNKAIERGIVFDGLRTAIDNVGMTDISYIGFGSVWFTDFHLAHRLLKIKRMISIEGDGITFQRAVFNRPYRTVDVRQGWSAEVIPDLLQIPEIGQNPIIVWLDYDRVIDEDKLDELSGLCLSLPDNSFLITTFSAHLGKFGNPHQRHERLVELFGAAAPDPRPSLSTYKNAMDFARILGTSVLKSLISTSLRNARPGGAFTPAFDLVYKDGTPMVTVGGFLPSQQSAQTARDLFSSSPWVGRVPAPITTAPLTAKEVSALQAALPHSARLTRADVNSMGFDLNDDQLDSFTAHYLRYPTFAQLV